MFICRFDTFYDFIYDMTDIFILNGTLNTHPIQKCENLNIYMHNAEHFQDVWNQQTMIHWHEVMCVIMKSVIFLDEIQSHIVNFTKFMHGIFKDVEVKIFVNPVSLKFFKCCASVW